jgi:hypothetical protein
MVHDEDPREKIIKAVGDLSKIVIMHNEILIGVYMRPEKTAGGIILTQTGIRAEDRWQGKVGLVLKKGPFAFVSDDEVEFGNQNVELHEWVVFHSADGWSLEINGQICRMVEDRRIRMKIPEPDIVY